MTKKYFLFFLLLFTCRLTASAHFNFNANCTEIYKTMFSLRLNDARAMLQREKQADPQNGVTILLDNYMDYLNLLVTENRADYNKWKDNASARIDALDNNDQNSPYYLFCQAEIYLQWGLLKGRFGDYMSSALDLRRANNLLKKNEEKFPNFTPDLKSLAMINVVFGELPPSLKGISKFLGMTGNATAGIKQLEELRVNLPKSKYSYYEDEVIFSLCNIDIDILHNKNNYARLIGYLSVMDSNSLLRSYLQGYISYKTAHNDDAINFIEAAPKGSQYISIPLMYYMLGNAKLNRLDPDAPDVLNRYLREYRGSNYIKDTYLKLAYYYLLKNDLTRYNNYVKLVQTKGYNTDEKDQQALREAKDARPDTDVLRARFYFDGGYYAKALGELKDKKVDELHNTRDKIEYYYRLGRIYEKTDKPNEAVGYYQKTIAIGKNTRYYYAANSALAIGQIYEQQKDYNRAATFYQQAIDMKDHEYQNSIQNEAKEGLKRINRD